MLERPGQDGSSVLYAGTYRTPDNSTPPFKLWAFKHPQPGQPDDPTDFVIALQGTHWKYNISGTVFPFRFGEKTIDDFPQWAGVTWQRLSNTQIRLVFPDNRETTMTFNSRTSFTGTDFDGQTAASGTALSLIRWGATAPDAGAIVHTFQKTANDKEWSHTRTFANGAQPDTEFFTEIGRFPDGVTLENAAKTSKWELQKGRSLMWDYAQGNWVEWAPGGWE